MILKRLLLITVLALAAAASFSTSASAGDIADEPCGDAAGPDTATCPAGTTGTPYSVTIKLKEGSGCGDAWPPVWTIDSGSLPPGLSLSSNGMAGATISGTPTEAGNFTFYVRVSHPFDPDHCAGDYSDKKFTIPISPGLPKLTIGPESAPVGTVSTPYQLQLTATVQEAKTWSIVDGALPAGLAIDAASGLISGTPTTAGTYVFTVRAAVTADTRADTKVLGIVVRNQVAVTAEEAPAAEVDVPFSQPLTATGGTGSFTWALTAGELPPGLALGTTGAISGTPTEAGSFRFTVSVVDTEGRKATLSETLKVASPVVVATRAFRPAKVGRYFEGKLRARGGVQPVTWKLKRGPLPRGIRFDRTVGLFYGTPAKAGTWRIVVEVRDALRVTSTQTVVLSVKATKLPKKK